MKIREDFVTNSSSTSFILAMKEELNKQNFMKNIGIEKETPMSKIFEDLYYAIEENKEEIQECINQEGSKGISDFLDHEGYDSETINIVKDLMKQGKKVYYGKLSSESGSSTEAYFCMESFVFCDDEIYFNGKIGGW